MFKKKETHTIDETLTKEIDLWCGLNGRVSPDLEPWYYEFGRAHLLSVNTYESMHDHEVRADGLNELQICHSTEKYKKVKLDYKEVK